MWWFMFKLNLLHCFIYAIIILLLFLSSENLLAEEYTFQQLMDSTSFYQEQQDYQTALEWAFRAEAKAKEQFGEMDTNYVASLTQIYICYYYMGNAEKAIEYCEKTKPIIKELRGVESPEYAEVVANLGFLYNSVALFTEAEPLFIEALEMSRRLFKGDHPHLARSINNMAVFYNDRGRYAEAEPLFIEALEMRRRLFKGDHPDLARSINSMAYFYDGRGRYSEAEPLYKEALEMMRRLFKGDHPDLARSINNMAAFYNDRGRYAEAEPLYKEALEMRRRLFKGDHPDLAQSINNMAVFYNDRGRYAEAEPLLIEALEMRRRLFKGDHPDLAQSINSMALFYNGRGRYAEAEPLYKEALEMSRRLFKGDHPDLARSINNMAGFYDGRGRYAEAEPLYIEALQVYTKVLENYFPSLSEKEKQQFWNTMSDNFEGFNSFVLNRYKYNPAISEPAYNNLLMTKAMLLSSTIKVKNTILNSGNKELIRKYEEWLWQKQNLSKYYSMTKQEREQKGINLDSLEKAANDREKELSKLSSDFAKLTEKKEYKWQDVQMSLKRGEAAIELTRYRYHDGRRWTDTVYYSALIVKPESKYPELVLLQNGNDLEKTYIDKYKSQVEKQRRGSIDFDNSNRTMQELYTQYWQPISEKLEGINTVYLSLDGVYNQFNLNTLINPNTGEYLLDELKVVQLTSTRDLIDKPQQIIADKSKQKTAVLFGDPKYELDAEEYLELASAYNLTREYYNIDKTLSETERSSIVPLPGTRKEVEQIEKELTKKQWEVKKYLGKEAVEEAVKTVNNPTLLHIATHGMFLKDVERSRGERTLGMEREQIVENPLLKSFLFFAGAENTIKGEKASNTDDGLLTAYEAQSLYLDETELVVLSACETGLGEVKNGEGVYGLQRAFKQAGAKSLIMSLWTVSDEATQELMSKFYRNWVDGMSKRESFNKAQQEIRKKYPAPYYWGAFVMVGE